jgi:hypothetical protein
VSIGGGSERRSTAQPLEDVNGAWVRFDADQQLTICCVHAATGEGAAAMKASRATIDEAFRDAAFALSTGSAFVWIIDGEGNLILPPGQVKARLNPSARSAPGFDR